MKEESKTALQEVEYKKRSAGKVSAREIRRLIDVVLLLLFPGSGAYKGKALVLTSKTTDSRNQIP